METVTIGTEPGPEAVLHSRRYAADGWLECFQLDLLARDFSASTTVENPGFGHPPSQLFNELAVFWQGWGGVKNWQAVEGELMIQATSDSTGHITLAFGIPGHGYPSPWFAEVRVLVEAGQLERLARDSNEFFARKVPLKWIEP